MGELLDKLILFYAVFCCCPCKPFPLVPGGSIGGFMPSSLNSYFPEKFSFAVPSAF